VRRGQKYEMDFAKGADTKAFEKVYTCLEAFMLLRKKQFGSSR
jgi:hypothetical protein